jgi:hypothetical protein
MPVAHHERVHRTAGRVTPIVIVDGRIAGTWELGPGGGRGLVGIRPWSRWRSGARTELADEVERMAAFLGRPLRTEVLATMT